MATTERLPTATLFTDKATQAAQIVTLRLAMQTGLPVKASDINSLAGMINNMLGHYHSYDDTDQMATYGNNGDRTHYFSSKNTSAGYNSTDLLSDNTLALTTAANTTITAARHNELSTQVALLAAHFHTIDDTE